MRRRYRSFRRLRRPMVGRYRRRSSFSRMRRRRPIRLRKIGYRL